jgi:hypothetical protein
VWPILWVCLRQRLSGKVNAIRVDVVERHEALNFTALPWSSPSSSVSKKQTEEEGEVWNFTAYGVLAFAAKGML